MHARVQREERKERDVRCARSSRDRIEAWIEDETLDSCSLGPTCIPQETAMSRRVLPCGLGGVIGGHDIRGPVGPS